MSEEEKTEEVVEEAEEKKEDAEPVHDPCPTCTEEWEGGAIFCDLCGYQETDEENPLHPTPVLEDGVADAAGMFSADDIAELKKAIGKLNAGVPIMLVTFNTPDDQTPGGIAFTLYNDFTVRTEQADLGLLVMIDPSRNRVEIALGKNIGSRIDVNALSEAASEYAVAVSNGRAVSEFPVVIRKSFEAAHVTLNISQTNST